MYHNFFPFYGRVVIHDVKVYTTLCLSIHLLMTLALFHLFTIVNNTAMEKGVQISGVVSSFNFWGHVPKIGIAGSYGNSVFHFLRTKHNF